MNMVLDFCNVAVHVREYTRQANLITVKKQNLKVIDKLQLDDAYLKGWLLGRSREKRVGFFI